ncbi:MAG: hypothetical protein LLG20_01955 [Acidobacteriales bacterium]|nr:hypothetical protein [Terriglobales bacterium]
MKSLVAAGAVMFLGCVGFAQQPGIGKRSNPFSISDTSYAARLQATVSGTPPYTGAPTGGGRAPRAAAVFLGGYLYQPAWPVFVIAPASPQPTQVVVNNFYSPDAARPLEREPGSENEETRGVQVYSAPSLAPTTAEEPAAVKREAKPAVYLLVFKDNSIQSVAAYWREAGKLHYLTVQGDHKSAPLESLDRGYTENLNRERGLEFKLKGN